MSSTRVYTPLQPISGTSIGVRITDWEDFQDHVDEFGSRSITPFTYESQETEGDGYPRTYTEYVYLQGFAGYPDSHDIVDGTSVFKLENFGYEYDSDSFTKFWERVASYCDSFEFYHAPANHFPTVAELLRKSTVDRAYHVTGEDDSIDVSKAVFEAKFDE